MDRVSTASAYGAMLNSLMTAEVNETNAGSQLSSGSKAQDLKGYGASAETLTAMQAATTQVTGFLNGSQVVASKLAVQNTALTQVAGAAGTAIQAVTQALASSSATGLMESLQEALGTAVQGLNSTYNGEYIFAGGQVNTQPVTAVNLTDLTSGAPISSLFNNDQRSTPTQINAQTSVNTGFLASNVGSPLFTALQTIQAYVNTNGPFTGTLTTAQSQFLTQQLSTLDTVQTGLTNVVGQNGQLQAQVTSVQTDLNQQQSMLQGLVGNVTNANLAQAATNLEQAQLAMQAAGQVFQALNSNSLLNTLTASTSVG